MGIENNTVEPHMLPEHSRLSLLKDIRKDHLKYFRILGDQHGSYCWFSLAGNNILFLNDAKAIEHVLIKNDRNYQRGKYNSQLKPIFGESLFLSVGENWDAQRRNVLPAFSAKNFPVFLEKMNEACDNMFQRWDKRIEEGHDVIDFYHEANRLALDVSLRSLFTGEKEEVLEHVSKDLLLFLQLAEDRIWSAFNLPLWLVLQQPKYKRALKSLRKVVDAIVTEGEKELTPKETLVSRLVSFFTGKPRGKKLLDDNVLAFLMVSHATTAIAMTWAMVELANHPESLQKTLEEIDRVTEDKNINLNDIRNLDYTFCVLQESLRLTPPAWTISRMNFEEDHVPIENGSILRVPKGTTLMLCIYAVCRNELYWDEPNAFKPERFEKENASKRPHFSFFPFGGGRHVCIGQRFAEVEATTAIAKTLQQFSLELLPDQGIKPKPILTLSPDRPVLFRIKRRER